MARTFLTALLLAGGLIVLVLAAGAGGAGTAMMAPALAAYGMAAALVLMRHRAAACGRAFGAANTVTLARLAIACAFVGYATLPPPGPRLAWAAFGLGVTALLADGLDGWLARRQASASAFGARFDMEVDAFLILVLAVIAWRADKAGAWVLLSGGARYLYVAAARAIPALRRPLFPSLRRKTVAVIQGGALVALLAPAIRSPLSDACAAAALALLTYSFAADILWQTGVRGRALSDPAALVPGN